MEHRLRSSVGEARLAARKKVIVFVCSHQSEFQQPSFGKLSQQCRNVGEDAVARSRIGLCEIVHNRANGSLPGTAFDDLCSDGVGFEHALRRK